MPISIRPARPDDLDTVVALSNALIQEDAGQRDRYSNANWAADEGHDYFRPMLTDPEHLILLAEDAATDKAARPVGFLVAHLKPPRPVRPVAGAELHSMFIHRADRSLGTGAAMVKRFAIWAAENEVKLISVSSYAANNRAISFYQSLGFEPASMSLEIDLTDLTFDTTREPAQ